MFETTNQFFIIQHQKNQQPETIPIFRWKTSSPHKTGHWAARRFPKAATRIGTRPKT